ncbi:hypothetical protein GCM10010360_18950 [Streptomyces nogalater]
MYLCWRGGSSVGPVPPLQVPRATSLNPVPDPGHYPAGLVSSSSHARYALLPATIGVAMISGVS